MRRNVRGFVQCLAGNTSSRTLAVTVITMTTVICVMRALPIHTRFASCRQKGLWSWHPSAPRSFPCAHSALLPHTPPGDPLGTEWHTLMLSHQTQLPLTRPLHSAHLKLNCYCRLPISKLRQLTKTSQIFLTNGLPSSSRADPRLHVQCTPSS